MNSISKGANSLIFALKKNSPKILFGVGLGFGGLAIGTAIYKTVKVTRRYDNLKIALEDIDKSIGTNYMSEELQELESYTEEKANEDKKELYKNFIVDTAVDYIPTAGCVLMSVVCLTGSHRIMNRRNIGLAALAASTQEAFSKYRERVKEKEGADADYAYLTGSKKMEIQETMPDGSVVTTEIHSVDKAGDTAYIVYITRQDSAWEESKEYMEYFFNAQQRLANDKLHKKGWLTLNEVYRLLGKKETAAGMVVGWVDDPTYDISDCKIEFDVREVYVPVINDYGEKVMDRAYSVNFNVDGGIYTRLAKEYSIKSPF